MKVSEMNKCKPSINWWIALVITADIALVLWVGYVVLYE